MISFQCCPVLTTVKVQAPIRKGGGAYQRGLISNHKFSRKFKLSAITPLTKTEQEMGCVSPSLQMQCHLYPGSTILNTTFQ